MSDQQDFSLKVKVESPTQLAFKRFRRNRLALICLFIFMGIALSCFIMPIFINGAYEKQIAAQTGVELMEPSLHVFGIPLYQENVQDPDRSFEPPSFSITTLEDGRVVEPHYMGTDNLGRDILSRLLYGGRISIAVGFIATIVALLIGVTWGASAGYSGGKVDEGMMRMVDILYSLPYLFFVILLVTMVNAIIEQSQAQTFLGMAPSKANLVLLFVAIGAVSWLTMSRIVRGQVLSLKEKEFIEAAKALGAGPSRILFKHLIPNTLGPIIVYATLTIPAIMLEEAFLSFLGLGIQPPNASWGTLASEGAAGINSISIAYWLVVFPGLALSGTLFCLTFIGDGLRDAFDPRQQG